MWRVKSARWRGETRKAEQAAHYGVGVAAAEAQTRATFQAAQVRRGYLYQAIDNGEGIGDINSADVPSWWKPGDLLTKKEEEVVADALASRFAGGGRQRRQG